MSRSKHSVDKANLGEPPMRRMLTTVFAIHCLAIIVTLGAVVYLWYCRRHLWETTSAVATVWLVYVALKELGDGNRTSRADFIRRFCDLFFREETRDLIMLLDNKALSFRQGKFPYFEIIENAVKQWPIMESKKKALLERKLYSEYEVDDWLLGQFEDLAAFEKSGLLDIEEIYNDFSWYIEVAWDNREIQAYIKDQRKEEDSKDAYEYFEELAGKLTAYGKKKRRSGMWWQFR